MKPGPPKTPTALMVLRGNPSKRPLPAQEPQPEAVAPKAPAHLSKAAKAEWRAVVGELASVPGLLTVADRATLELFARTMARYRSLEAHVETHGAVLEVFDKEGGLRFAQPSPYASLSAKLLPQIRGLAGELGLSPSSRTRIAVPSKPASDTFTNFLKRTV